MLRPFQGNLKASVYTYNEEELESELLAWDLDVICNFLTDRLSVGNYTFCCGIIEENLVKMDLKVYKASKEMQEDLA